MLGYKGRSNIASLITLGFHYNKKGADIVVMHNTWRSEAACADTTDATWRKEKSITKGINSNCAFSNKTYLAYLNLQKIQKVMIVHLESCLWTNTKKLFSEIISGK